MKDSNILSSANTRFQSAVPWLLTGIRLLIGWHFLYEGVSKLFVPNWTAAGYLLESHWLLSGFLHWIAGHPMILDVVNFINVWGLIFVGLGLFLGTFTRLASVAGATMLLLYFVANPPLLGFAGEATGEGHYLIINKNLIEMIVLLLLAFVPRDMFFGVDRWLSRLAQHSADPAQSTPVGTSGARREFLKDLAGLPLFGGFAYSVFQKKQWESFEERHLISQPSRVDAVTGASPTGANFASVRDLTARVACGNLGDFKISRLICGGNLISGYAHSRDLIYVSSLVQSYFSDEKVLEAMRLCEVCGINTIVLRVDKNTLRIMEKYRRRNGKMHWIAQSKITEDDIRSDIDAATDSGAMAAYIHGGVSDKFVAEGKIEILRETIEHIRKRKVLAGLAGHQLEVIMASEKAGINVDFYMKTLNSGNYWTAGPRLPRAANWEPDPFKVVEPEFMRETHDNIWSVTPQQTIAFMQQVKKPWIAYKVLGAGAIHPRDGLKYAFENGADFACVGMFDFQIVENANILNDVLTQVSDANRSRPWLT